MELRQGRDGTETRGMELRQVWDGTEVRGGWNCGKGGDGTEIGVRWN